MTTHTLDGYDVNLLDKVFAVGHGAGTVVELLLEGRFRVEFISTGRIVTFDGAGIMARAEDRSLFWHNPVLTPPQKNEANWHRIKPVVTSLIDAYRQGPPA